MSDSMPSDSANTPFGIRITVNGEVLESAVESRTLLVDFLRSQAKLTGTRIGCDEGACGACTVELDGQTVKSWL